MFIEETDSTNSLMQRLLRGEEPQYAACLEERIPLLYTSYQTAGRGQTGNGWESERGQNLLLSYLLREPQIKASEQFELNILAAVLTHLALKDWLTDAQKPLLTIKWPNDIYYGDRKIAGILVENSLAGRRILHSIAGVGINVNQERWVGGAPNPVSIKQLIGVNVDVDTVAQRFIKLLEDTLQWEPEQQNAYYRSHLYRREGYWPFVEREVSATPTMNAPKGAEGQFMACIKDILPTGELVLTDQQGQERTYHFKQIRYVI